MSDRPVDPYATTAVVEYASLRPVPPYVYDIQTDTTRPMTDDERAIAATAFARANIAPGDS